MHCSENTIMSIQCSIKIVHWKPNYILTQYSVCILHETDFAKISCMQNFHECFNEQYVLAYNIYQEALQFKDEDHNMVIF